MNFIKFQSRAIIFILLGLLISSCGIPVQVAPTSTSLPPTIMPTDTPEQVQVIAVWNEIPIMPEAISGQEEMGDFQFTVNVSAEEIQSFYEQKMTELAWENRQDMTDMATGTEFTYAKGNTFAFFKIDPQGEGNIVYIHIVEG